MIHIKTRYTQYPLLFIPIHISTVFLLYSLHAQKELYKFNIFISTLLLSLPSVLFKKQMICPQFLTFFNPLLRQLFDYRKGHYNLFLSSKHLSHLCLKPLVFPVGVRWTFNTNIPPLSPFSLLQFLVTVFF